MKFRLKPERVVRGTTCFKLQRKLFPFVWIDCTDIDKIYGTPFVPDFVTSKDAKLFAENYAKIRGSRVAKLDLTPLKTNRIK